MISAGGSLFLALFPALAVRALSLAPATRATDAFAAPILAFQKQEPIAQVAPAIQKQEPIRFDPSRDLEGFDACFNSEFRDLYPIETYSALLAKEMKPEELADVQKRWKKDVADAEAKLAKLRADPVEESVWLLEHRLDKSRYFSHIAWNEDRSVPGFVVLVQKLSPDLPGYGSKIAQKYGPWLQKIGANFDSIFAKPLGLTRRKGRAVTALMVLSSQKEYENFWQIHKNFGSTARTAAYDLRLGVAVGYDDPFKPAPSGVEQRLPILNAVVRGLIDEHSSAPDGRPGALWVEEGIATYLSEHQGEEPTALDDRGLRPEKLRALMELAGDKSKGQLLFHPIEDLVGLQSSEEVDRIVVRLWKGLRSQAPTEQDVRSTFYGQSALWIHFLDEAKSGAYRAATAAYLKSAFAGDGGEEALRRAFAGKDLAAIDREFLTWFTDVYKEAGPSAALGVPTIDALFDRHGRLRSGADAEPASSGPSAGSSGGAAPAAGAGGAEPSSSKSASTPAPKAGSKSAAAPATSTAFSPALLAPDPADVVSRHGVALVRAKAGDLESAIATLDELSRADIAAEERPRVARDLARVRELAKLRDAFFANLQRTGAKWTIVVDGKKVPVSVEKIEGGFLEVSRAGKPGDKIPLASIPPAEIANQANDKEQRGDSASYARAYALLLADDARWEKFLRDDSEDTKTLREDAKSWFPDRIKAAAAAEAMTALSTKPLPASAPDGEAMCAAIQAILKTYGGSALVKEKRPILRHVAEIAAGVALDKANLGQMLRGKFTSLPEGRAKLVYDFQDAAQATDFVKTKGYLAPWRETQAAQVAPESESSWEVKAGRFVGIGGTSYRLPVEFSAPMSVKYRLRVLEGKDQNESIVSFGVGICDDGKEDLILALGFGDLLVRDTRGSGGTIEHMPKEFLPLLNTSYEFEVKHDGNNTTTTFDKKKGCEAPTPTLKSGQILLYFHTNLAIAIEKIEIEGRLVPSVLPELKQAGIERRLAELGFQ